MRGLIRGEWNGNLSEGMRRELIRGDKENPLIRGDLGTLSWGEKGTYQDVGWVLLPGWNEMVLLVWIEESLSGEIESIFISVDVYFINWRIKEYPLTR